MYHERKEFVINVTGAAVMRQMEDVVAASSKNNNEAPEEDLTDRVLLTLTVDLTLLHETVEQLTVKVHAMLKQRGLPTATPAK